jgi:hypothetical protein
VHRATDTMRWLTVLGLMTGIGFLIAPVNADVEPFAVGRLADSVAFATTTPTGADSLTEDIILYNLFAPSRTAPSRRYASNSAAGDASSEMAPSTFPGGGFTPELIGTAVSEKPGETKALLRLLASDPTPRLYAVGDRAGGFTVVSIDARGVVLSGPRGRVVLRLPENEENHS